ncbi:hypothetical protein GRF59_06565 [Paenibacillus sp. HJL G12]|uniref:Uncharacterized protein n=1 Tax=Paenibacillus dendrobii TaxID=2691084 RepID=A0A7X3IHA7_9BACL|nr:hypothetical protein [Paenibacillus dendrobii]MWV43291.1 hypothetical protein [Paenibacillus dendrobii]
MNKKKLIIPFILLIILLIPFGISYFSYQSQQISNEGAEAFSQRLQAALSDHKPFKMSDLTPVDWDKIVVFHPYATKSEMEKTTGITWTTRTSYVGYLLERTFLGEYPLDDDSLNKLVFMKEGSVVLDVTLNRSTADFTAIQEIRHDQELQLAPEDHGHKIVISTLK